MWDRRIADEKDMQDLENNPAPGKAPRPLVLVVDDETLGRQRVLELLESADVEVVGTAADGMQAVEAIRALKPDVVFLDVQLPELSGIEVVERFGQLDAIPAVVFTTAFDQYAVTAFELEAVDYLLKPFGASRFHNALERARLAVASRGAAAALDRARVALVASNSYSR